MESKMGAAGSGMKKNGKYEQHNSSNVQETHSEFGGR